ncbi:MAG: hypothetical protein ABL908_13700 [Hyphomicrobium sp.]
MSRTDYLGSLGTLALAVVVSWLILRPLAGERWFDIYGSAAIALAATLGCGAILARRYRTIGRSPWRAALVGAPIALLAMMQIGYWATVFSLGHKAVGLVLVRSVIRDAVGPWMPVLAALLLGTFAWALTAAARPTSHLDR